jgi:hypothetical protein
VRPFVTTPGTFILTERSLIFEPVNSSISCTDTASTSTAGNGGTSTAATAAGDDSSDSAAVAAAAIEDGFVLVPTVAELQSSEPSDSRADSADVAACDTPQQQQQQPKQQQQQQQQEPQGSHTWVLPQCDTTQQWELSLLVRIAPRAHLHQVSYQC